MAAGLLNAQYLLHRPGGSLLLPRTGRRVVGGPVESIRLSGMDGTWVTWTSALVAVMSAVGAFASLVVTMREGRALRRNTEFLAHRDQWWKRWSWVVERTFSDAEHDTNAAFLMATALSTRGWTTRDDKYMFDAVRVHIPDEEETDDLEAD